MAIFNKVSKTMVRYKCSRHVQCDYAEGLMAMTKYPLFIRTEFDARLSPLEAIEPLI